MHRCLNIVEVQRAIFRIVLQPIHGPATLAKLARTCRAFNVVALDVLWAKLDSFVYLIRCLPRDLWKMEPDRRIIFQRPMSLRDWEIFFRYSARVRIVLQTVGPEILTKCIDLGDDVIFALSNPPTYGPLLPYLKTLHWDKPVKKYASLLRLLLTPSLVTLQLSHCVLHSPEVSVLTCIGTVCPSLKRLCIPIKPFTDSIDVKGEKILSEALLYLHSLETLTCPALDEAAIIHLSHLPFLANLSMELQLDFQLEKVKPFLVPPAFASLQLLTLHANSLSTLTSLLECMQFGPRALWFVVANVPTPDALRLFFLALQSACTSEQVTRISLTVSTNRARSFPTHQVTLSTFQTLLTFPNIQTFEFDVPCDVALDDDAIATMTKHWPNLTSLSINARSGWGITPRVTHHGLITLLSRCTSLSEFALAIDFGEIDGPPHEIPESRPGQGVMNTQCRVGNFVTSVIMYPVTVAAFLSDVCPELETVRCSWTHTMIGMDMDLDEMDVYRERWEETENLLPAFNAVRKQCMEWAQRSIKEDSAVGSRPESGEVVAGSLGRTPARSAAVP